MRSLFGVQDVLELVENGYEDLVANATDVQRVAFKEQKIAKLSFTFNKMWIQTTLKNFKDNKMQRSVGHLSKAL